MRQRLFSIAATMALITSVVAVLAATPAPATATGTTFSDTATIALRDPGFSANPNCSQSATLCNATASPYPSTLAVSGLSGTISKVTVTLNQVGFPFSQDIDALLVGPGGQSLILVSELGPNGGASAPANNSTITFSDAGTGVTAPTSQTPWGNGQTFTPSNFGGFNQDWTAPAPASGWGNPGPDTTNNGTGACCATFASEFNGTNPNGTWSLYVVTTQEGDGIGTIAGGWSIDITAAPAVATTTTLASGPNPSFTTSPNQSVTLTASVTSTSTVNSGTVAFLDGNTAIGGCGAQAVSNGQATCVTTFTTEGNHSLLATYGGTSGLGPSTASLTQQVNDHTTVNGSNFCNTGSIALNNPPTTVADASPYPSRVFVSGLSGTIGHLAITLGGVSYPHSQDIDALLVGPGGQSLILVAAAGPGSGGALSNVTLTLDDNAPTTLASAASWGATNATVSSKAVNYGGVNETFASPAPAGPYGNPGPSGGGTATLGTTFDGTNPNGTWSLYLITTAAGDGTGAVSGGWCAGIVAVNVAATNTTITSSNNPSFTTSPGNTVTLTATVTNAGDQSAVGEGTVAFTDGGTTISGCGSQPVSGGQATCTTSFSAQGAHTIEAGYSGDANFGASNAGLTQQVDNHVVVSGSAYCNTGSITLNNPDIDHPEIGATPYPSNIAVSGLGNVAGLTVSLDNVSYSDSQDIDALLVGPGGQSLILVAAAGPNSGGSATNVTLTLSDSASSTLSGSAAWGAANSTVITKAVNYGGNNENFASPAPSGPYGNPGPFGGGSATLAGTFGGTNPNGTWSLYLITTAAGDGTGAVAGGWCLGLDVTPSLSTTAGAPVGLGGSVSDTATLMGSVAPTGAITFRIYGPGDPTCATVLATSSATVAGNGSYTSSPYTPTSTGTYRWVASYSGDANNNPVSGDCGDSGESVAVTPASPTVATTASGPITIGGSISDTATLSGGSGPSGPTGTIGFAVYGPDDATCATALATSTVSVNGDGTYDSPTFTPSAPGTYQWVASYGGDTDNDAATGACGDPGESVAVSQAIPSISTTASPTVAAGGTINDTATLAGGFNPTGTITFSLYVGDPTCTTALTTSTATVSGNGTYSSASFTTSRAGDYQWVATYGGDTDNASSTGTCVTVGESVQVTRATPTLATAASATVAAGGTITDTATLAGGVAPGGTITFNLYGPGDASCSAPPVFTSTKAVAGDGVIISDPFTATAVGEYHWVATYSGDPDNVGLSEICGAVGESVAVTPPLNGFTPVGPERICDTRASGPGVAANQCNAHGHSPLSTGSILTTTVAGAAGVPADAVAVALRVTVTGTNAASYLTVWPSGQTRPTAASLTWAANQTTGTTVQAAVGTGGQVSLYNYGGSADVVVDVTGYFSSGSEGLFTAASPTRVCDTRAGTASNQCNTGSGSGPLGAGASRALNVVNGFGLPSSTTAVVLNVTAVLPSSPSYLTIWPDGATRPLTSSLNWNAGQVVSGRVVVGVSAAGKVDLYNAFGTANLVVDLDGYFAATGGGSGYFPIDPARICDTRNVGTAVASNQCDVAGPETLSPGGRLGMVVLGNNVTAVVATVTVTGTGAGGYLIAYPGARPQPAAPDFFWTAGQTTGNLVSPAANLLAGSAVISVFNGSPGKADVVVDESGYYSTVGP